MTQSEKLARRLAKHCVSEVCGNRWFNKNKAATVIEAAFADVIKQAEKADKENARLRGGIEAVLERIQPYRMNISPEWVRQELAALLDKPEEKQ